MPITDQERLSLETCCGAVVGGHYSQTRPITFLEMGMCQCKLVTATAATCYYLKCMPVPVA